MTDGAADLNARRAALQILLASATGEEYSESVREYTTCRSCHKIIAPDFRYCPYCGTQRIRPFAFRSVMDQSFSRMDRAEQVYSLRRLQRIERNLLVLETDIEALLTPEPDRRQ